MSSEPRSPARVSPDADRPSGAPSTFPNDMKRNVARRHRRTVGVLLPAAILELLAALIACIPQLADAGTQRSWHLVTVAVVAVALTARTCWRTRSLDAGKTAHALSGLLSALLCAEIGRWAWLLVRAGAPARHDTTAAVCAGAAALLLAVGAAYAPRASWLVADAVAPLDTDQWQRVLVNVVTLLLVAFGAGAATDRIAVDATTSDAPERNAQLPVSGVAWRTSVPDGSDNVVATRLGPALFTSGLHVLDGATGRELWHRGRRFVQPYRYSVDDVTASPDGEHLAIVETSSPVDGESMSWVTVLDTHGRLVRTIANATAVALTNDAMVTVADKAVTARDWQGHVRWVRPLDEGCGRIWTMTTSSVLVSNGCEYTKLLTQVDGAGSALAQAEWEGYDEPIMVHAPDFSSTMLNADPYRFPGAFRDRWFRPTLMFDDRGSRDVSMCHEKGPVEVESCMPGEKGSKWVTQSTRGSESLTVVDASGHAISHAPVPQECRLVPIVGGTARLCDVGSSAQLPGSSAVQLPDEQDGLRVLWPAGGGWIVVTPSVGGTGSVIALR